MRFPNRYNINFSRAILSLTGHAKTSKNIGVIDMNDNQKAFTNLMFLVFFVVGLVLGHLITSGAYKNEALKAGVGYYDAQTGDFKYKIMDEKSGM